jgi:type II secretory pathway component HofQ
MKTTLAPLLIAVLAVHSLCPSPVMAQSRLGSASLDQNTVIDGEVSIPNGGKRVSVSVANENIRTVLRSLSEQGGFNLVMDESVTGQVTIELNKVSLNQAVQSVAALGDLKILKQSGNIFLAISRQMAQQKGLERQLSKIIPINYTNASLIASVLNRSIFTSSSPAAAGGGAAGGGAGMMMPQKAMADARTNSIILVGTAQDIALGEATIARMDIPRQSKTFYLSNANALDVATLLAGSAFNDGTASFTVGAAGGGAAGGGGAGGQGGAGATMMPAALRVERQDVQEGSGINNFGGSGGNGSSAGLSSSVTLRGFIKTQDTANVSPDSALVIPDTRQNAITILGTAEQIALAESMIPTFDAQLPQVSIEAALVEITDTNSKEFSTRLGIADGKLQLGFNNQPLSAVSGNGLIGLSTTDPTDVSALARSAVSFNTNPAVTRPDYGFQLRSLIARNKAKILANPTVVATHDTESIISIVDEIVRRVVTTIDESGFATQTVEIGEAGIVMDILPKIGEDGTITMRIRPSVTSVLREELVLGNLVTLLSKRDLLTQNVRMKDGETLVIGGLIQEQSMARREKLPGLSNLPIVGAMFRASQQSGSRSELVLMITPHIINKTKLTPVITSTIDASSPSSLAGGQ